MSKRRLNLSQGKQRKTVPGSNQPHKQEDSSLKRPILASSKNPKRVKIAARRVLNVGKFHKILIVIQSFIIQAVFTSYASNTKIYPTGDLSTLCDDYKHHTSHRLVFGAWITLNTPLNAGEAVKKNDFIWDLKIKNPSNSLCRAFEPSIWMFIGFEYNILNPTVCQTKFTDPGLTCCLEFRSSFTNLAAIAGRTCDSGSTQNFGGVFGLDVGKEITEKDTPPGLNTGALVVKFKEVFSASVKPSDIYRQNIFFMMMAGEPKFLSRNSFTKFAPNHPTERPLAVDVTIDAGRPLGPNKLESGSTTDPALWRGVYESITPFGLRINGNGRITDLGNFGFFWNDLVGCATITTSFVLVNHKDDPVAVSGGFVELKLDFLINSKNIGLMIKISRDPSNTNRVSIDVFNDSSQTISRIAGELQTVDGWKKDDFVTIWGTFHLCPFLSNSSIFVNGVIEGQHSRGSVATVLTTLSFTEAGYHFPTQMIPDQKIKLGIKTSVNGGDDEGLRIYLKEVVQISGGYSPYLVDKNSLFSSAIPHSGRLVLGLDAANQIVPTCENFYYVDESLDFGKGCVNTGNRVGGCVEMRDRAHCDRCESSTYFINKIKKDGDGACRSRSGGCEQPGYLRYSEDECSSCSTSLGGCICNEFQEKTAAGGCQCKIKNCNTTIKIKDRLANFLIFIFYSFHFRIFKIFARWNLLSQ